MKLCWFWNIYLETLIVWKSQIVSNCVFWLTVRNTSSGNVVLVAHRFRVLYHVTHCSWGLLIASARYGLVDCVKRKFKSVQKKLKEDIYKGSGEKKV